MLKKNTILIFLLLSPWAKIIKAQYNNVKPEDAKLATELKNKYPDQSIAAVVSKEIYSFSLNPKSLSSPVAALETSINTMMALKDNYTFSDAIYYNFQSEVIDVRAKGLRGRPVDLYPQYKKYESNGIFYDDASLCVYTYPLTTRGEKIDLEYKKRYYDVKYLTSAYFHGSYPIEEKVISFEIPDWLTVELKEMNFEGYNIKKSEVHDSKKLITTYTFTAKKLQARKSESHSPSLAKNYPHILVLCKKYKNKDGESNLFNTVDDLYAWYASLCKKIGNDDETLKPVVAKLIEGKKTDIEKIEAIYYWVQENIRYIAFEDGIMGFKPAAAQDVYKNKYGDCKGKANLMTQMLKIAGYDARKTWIGTSSIPYDYTIPSLAVDNHMICTLILNGKRYFLDGTEDYIAFNDYAHRIQGRPVLIEDGSKYILDKVPEYNNERNKVQTNIQLSVSGDLLKGSLKETINGEGKTDLLRGYASVRSDNKEDALRQYLSSGDKNIQLSNIITSDMEEREKPLDISYDFELQNYITQIGNETYLNIDQDKEYGNWDFDSTRVNDYELYHKVLIVSHTELKIPVGFKIDYLPESVNKKHSDFSFNLSYTINEDKIIYDKKITVDNAIIRKKDFPIWNEYVKAARTFYNDQIILIKK